MKYITKEVRIGIAGIVALCVLIYGINWLKGIHMFQPSSYFYAKFENVNGLTKSSPVFADGVRVGIVRDIYYDYAKPGNVIVEVELDTELRIPKGSSAELVSELMGGVRMNILLANNPREKYAVGDTIPGTLNNGMMESAAKLIPKVEEMLPKLDYWKRYDELSDNGQFEEFKQQLMEEINDLHIEGLPQVKELNALVGKYVNLMYTLPNGEKVKFLDDQKTYLGNQLECVFGGSRRFGIVVNMDFIMVCTYEEDGENPELLLYKKR